MKDPRERNRRHLQTTSETRVIDWASEKQKFIFEYGPAPLCASGAYNCGKTIGIVLKMLYIADRYPGYRWLVARRVWDDIKKTTMPSFFKFCPRQAYEPDGRRSDAEKILQLNNGSSFVWMHLEDPDAISVLNGMELNGFFFNQAEDMDEEVFIVAMNRLNRWDQVTVSDAIVEEYTAATGQPWPYIHEESGRRMPPSYPLLDCNPSHELHWIYSRFHPESPEHIEKKIRFETDQVLPDGRPLKAGEPTSYQELGYKMVELASYENKYATKQSLAQAEQQDETWKRRFYHGRWGIPEGQIHNVSPLSVLEPEAVVLHHIMQRCTLHRSMDHGDSAPTCVLWWAVDGDGNVFFYREYYAPNQLISTHREAVAGLSKYERYQFQLADPSIFGPSMQKHNQRWSVAEEWADCANLPRETAVFWEKGDNDEFGTRNRISEYLKPQGLWRHDSTGELVEVPRPHPITKEMGRWPRIFYVKKTQDYPNGCDHVIRQTKSQRREKIGTENGKPIFSDERSMKIPDHAYDPERYAMASQPPLPHSVPKKYAENSFFGRRAMVLKMKKRGQLTVMAREAKAEYRRRFR